MSTASPKFWNRLAEKYASSPVADQDAYEVKLEITQRYLHPEMEVLEIGCGTGTTSLIHAPHVRHILATDISEKMIEIARCKAEAQDVQNVTFQVVPIDDLEIAEGSMNVVMAHSILHLVEDRNAVIAKAYQWLKPGGVFVSSTICMSDAYGFMRPIMPIGRALGFFPMVKFFSEDELGDSVSGAGFDIHHQWKPNKKAAVFILAKKPD